MAAMKIVSITVVDDQGNSHTWRGDNGHVYFMVLRESGGSKQAPGKLLGTQVQAYITPPVTKKELVLGVEEEIDAEAQVD